MSVPVLGMRGTGNWSDSDMRPKDWREMIAFLYPNGRASLTAILAMMSKERAKDPEFNWWTEELQAVSALGNVEFSPGVAWEHGTHGAGSEDDTVYFNLTTNADYAKFREGHVVMIRFASATTGVIDDCRAIVLTSPSTGLMTMKLLEDGADVDDTGLEGATIIINIGSAHAEGAGIPTALSTDPVKYTNFTQIFRTSLAITGTQLETDLRTSPEAYQKLKMQALERHGFEMEFAFLFGKKREEAGGTGNPRRFTDGIVNFIETNVSANIRNWMTDTGYGTGSAWKSTNGVAWMEESLEQVFRFGSEEKLMLCGTTALLNLERLMKFESTINIEPVQNVYGFDLRRWTTSFGTIFIKTHPLFSSVSSLRHMGLILEPRNITYKHIKNRDTKFFPDKDGNNSGNRIDGRYEEFLTECGLELMHPKTMMIMNNIGLAARPS